MGFLQMMGAGGKSSSGGSASKGSKNNKNKQQAKRLPTTIQDSIPYSYVYENGIIETLPGHFTKSYKLKDINFQSASNDDQENLFVAYNDFLNSFGSEIMLQVVIFNRDIDKNEFTRSVLINPHGDGFDDYRNEMNEMLLQKLEEGHNNIIREKYLVISTKAEGIDAAIKLFQRIDVFLSFATAQEHNTYDNI